MGERHHIPELAAGVRRGHQRQDREQHPDGYTLLELCAEERRDESRLEISKDGYNNEQQRHGDQHLEAVVLASGQGTLYVDGLVANGGAISLRPVDLGTIDYAYLGKSQFTSDPYFDGQIDEFRVYGPWLAGGSAKKD